MGGPSRLRSGSKLRARIRDRWLSALLGLVAAGGCGGEPPVADLDDRGFLDRYEELRPTDDGDALRIFVDPSGAVGFYAKILIDPVTIRASGIGGLADVPPQEQQALADE